MVRPVLSPCRMPGRLIGCLSVHRRDQTREREKLRYIVHTCMKDKTDGKTGIRYCSSPRTELVVDGESSSLDLVGEPTSLFCCMIPEGKSASAYLLMARCPSLTYQVGFPTMRRRGLGRVLGSCSQWSPQLTKSEKSKRKKRC